MPGLYLEDDDCDAFDSFLPRRPLAARRLRSRNVRPSVEGYVSLTSFVADD